MTTWQLFKESVALSKLRLEYFEEGLCAQVMHIGPYETEPAAIKRMREFMKENRYRDCVVWAASTMKSISVTRAKRTILSHTVRDILPAIFRGTS
jgi:hypothetical protein